MADTAVSAGEHAGQRREHLPRQQPQQPLRPTAPVMPATGVPNLGAAQLLSASDHRPSVRPLSAGAGYEQGIMGPHPGTTVPGIVNSIGGRTGEVHDHNRGHDHNSSHDHSNSAHAQMRHQAKASYLQQRASGTMHEHVFNGHDASAAAAPAAVAKHAALASGASREAHYSAGREAHYAGGREAHYGEGAQAYRSSRRMVGPYQLAKTIGAGSMGKVKVALDTRTNKRVAAKIIPLQQLDAPIYFPSGLDTASAAAAAAAAAKQSGPVDASAEPWQSWLRDLALESHPELAVATGGAVNVQRKLRLLQPRERYTTKDRERRENKDIRVVREVAINRLLFHPHICMLHDVIVHPNHYYIFQELVSGGQMLDYIISHGRLKEKHARKFARQIASAIDYCHHNSIVHRDLKIENILISANGNIKLIDFGLSNLYSPRAQLSTFCGSLYFAAPELLNAQPYTGPEVDLWSFGVVLYVLVCGKVPFDDQSMPALHAKIKRGHVEYPAWLTPECRHLLSRLLVVSPLRRATMGEVVRHPWMCRGYDRSLANHLPTRTPLVSPNQIDQDVVREMAQYIGFGFGSEEEIRVGLEAMLTEDWYRSWLKDRLAPHLNALRTQLQEQVVAATPPPDIAPVTQPGVDASSGATLTNPADATVLLGEPLATGESGRTLSSRPSRGLRIAGSSTAPAKPGDTDKPVDVSSSDSMRKRASFWKRSSTFISGGLARATHKAGFDPHAPSAQAVPTGSEKHQLGQFRVLSGRIFSDSRHTGAAASETSGHEYPILPLSAHAPRMHVDQATGMVSIWSDGKLAPADIECAAIQEEYHDLVATDPLLSIYFLVKERREREVNHALHYQSARQDAQARLQQGPAAQTAAGARVESKDGWVKLDHASKKPLADSANVLTAEDRGAKAAQDIALAISGSSAERQPGTASAGVLQSPEAQLMQRPGTTGDSTDAAAAAPVDQTTAAIEALSRGSGMLSATHSAGSAPGAGFQDSRRKRSSIFKRLSVIVKGTRSGPKSAGAHADPTSRIIQAEGKESGYMEISVQKSNADRAAAKDSSSESAQQQHPSPLHLLNPEAIGARLRGNASAQKYTALDCIDEDKELSSDSPANVAGRCSSEAVGDRTEPKAQDTAAQSSESSKRQYLGKPLNTEAHLASETPGDTHISTSATRTLTPVLVKDAATTGSPDVPARSSGDAGSSTHPTPKLTKEDSASHRDSQRASHDLDDASSMFTATDIEDSAPATGRRESESPTEKAALLEKARREIEGLDEQEGVGLLDQTPELSYRVTGQFAKSNFDSKKRRARSSSNTVVRMLTDIVRDAGSGAGSRAGRAVQGAKATFPHVPGLSGRTHAKTILRHSSTGAINRAGDDSAFADRALGSKKNAGQSPKETDGFSLDDAEAIAAGRPDILRSHSHTVGNSQRGSGLPERIAEVPESPARLRQAPTNALGIETGSETDQSPDDIQATDSKCEDLAGASLSRESRDRRSTSSELADLNSSVEPTSPAGPDDEPDSAENDIMNNINSNPPRADEHLKPVFLKGLFSVSTTSTRSPTVIRANLLRVMGDMPLRFHEGKGYFTCSMATSGGSTNIQESVLDAYVLDDSAMSKNSSLHKQRRALRLPVVDRKISFRRKSKRMDEAALALTASGEIPASVHEDMSSNEGNASDSHQSAAESAGPAHGLPQRSRRRSSGTAICFQIFLVRMPLLGLYGLQFRRVSGPTWKYKDACSEILKRLKL
ncbi:Serine/threonine-protein kinase [Coemansia sp. RSA 522]|nr:Serine/threonine-protein kinase [Coemansia sp. RSA 522]